MTSQPDQGQADRGTAGYEEAASTVAEELVRGTGFEQIAEGLTGNAAKVLSSATTAEEMAAARDYDKAAQSFAARLRAADAVPLPAAGTPHPDPTMASLGWHTGAHGIYEKSGVPGAADVVALQRCAAGLRVPDRQAV
jgi:hypothetical protein